MREDILYIVMPAYNEEQNIRDVVLKWREIFKLEGVSDKSKIVIADSGSTDLTDDILKNMRDIYRDVEILKTAYKEHGPKLIDLYRYAASKADYVFQTDSDGQTNPEEFKEFWVDRNSYAALFGVRRNRGDGCLRTFVEKVVCILCFLYFGINIPDANAPFRLMRTDFLRDYLKDFQDDYAIPNIVLTVYYTKFCKCSFRDITFVKRSKGKQTLNFRKILSIGMKSLADFWYFKKKLRIKRK